MNEQINQNIDVIRVVHEYYMEKLNDEDFKIRSLIDSDRDWFKKNKDLLILVSQYRPILLSESMKDYKSIEDNIKAQGNILMIILEEILRDFKYGMVFGLADHENKGDAAINWAQYRVLEHFGINIVYYCTSNKSHKNCDLNESLKIAEKLQPPPIIILTGGGNLGNLWPVYENERQNILNQFQNFNVIIFPQSIALSNLAAKKQFQKLLLYPNLKILVRDFYSFSFLSSQLNIDNSNSNLPKIYLTPDIVTSLAFIKKNNLGTEVQDHKKISPSWDILWINRQDREKNLKANLDNEILKFVHENNEENENIDAGLANRQLKTSIHVDDWIKYSPTPYFGGIKKGRNILLSKVNAIQHNKPARTQSNPSFDFGKSNEATFDEFSYGVSLQRFCRGLEFIYQGKVLISDRLHGHILALLSNMKHVLLDTKYNKISNYYKTWTYSIKDEILIADSNNNALQLASKLVINNEDLNLDLYYNEC